MVISGDVFTAEWFQSHPRHHSNHPQHFEKDIAIISEKNLVESKKSCKWALWRSKVDAQLSFGNL
jgi:hypothetical protein